jgi:PAB-dependent poly(A)-specific ribonuclease subunit 2
MKKGNYICAATDHDAVDVLDPLTFDVVKTWKAHGSGLINDMDVQNNFVVTCGMSPRAQQGYVPDSYVNVFDLKNMSSLSPIAFPPLAAHVRMHPRMSSTCIISSQRGQLHVVDLMNPNTTNIKYANISNLLTKIELAPTGEALALADSDCYIHLWGSQKIRFSEIPRELEFPSTEQPSTVRLDWKGDQQYNSLFNSSCLKYDV